MTEETRKLALKTLNEIKDEMETREETRYLMAMIMAITALETPRDWTPCADGMPTADGTYDVTLKSEFGRYFIEQNARFENGEWLTESDTGKVLAWMSPVAPYRADDTTGKVKAGVDNGN